MEPRTDERRIRVLHVDDDADFLERAAAELERVSDRIEVETATTAEAGLARVADGGIDCVVSDYELSGTDGLAFLESVREERPDLPFVLFTGEGSEALASEAISAGVTDYLRKRAGSGGYELLANRVENAVARYRTERALETTRQRLSELAESTDDVLWMVTPDWEEVLFVNDAYERVWGRSKAALAEDPRDFLDGVHPEDRDRVTRAMARVAEGSTVEVEFRLRTGDGRRWIRAEGYPVVEDGDVARVVGVARDVTERKERERALKRNRGLLDALSAAFPDYAFVYDDDGRYLDVVTGWRGEDRLYADEELRGRTVHELLDEGTADRIVEAVRAALDDDDIRTVEYGIDRDNGTSWYEGRVAPLPEPYDGERAALLVARDVTARREYRTQLERQNERLDEFVSAVSHDLRNPLGAARGRAKLARQTGDVDYLDGCIESMDHMEALIEDLLTLARQGDVIAETEPVDLATVVEGCWERVDDPGATLRVETDRTVRADGDRLRQLVENLLDNCIEHAGPDATVTVGDTDDGFYVADDGPGIPPGERDEVFDRGYSTTAGGTGFGLSIVERIAEAHGWTVAAAESDGGGTRFEVSGVGGD